MDRWRRRKGEEEEQQQGKVKSRDVANKSKVNGAKEGPVEKKRKKVERGKNATPKEPQSYKDSNDSRCLDAATVLTTFHSR
jgi:hypothetical protein